MSVYILKNPQFHFLLRLFSFRFINQFWFAQFLTKARRGLNAVKVMARDIMPQRNLSLLVDMLVLSHVDYVFRILTLSNTQLGRLNAIQNEGMSLILGLTRNMSTAAIRYVLGLPAMRERNKLAQVSESLRRSTTPPP